MFDGVPADQLHQFITSTRTSSLPLPLPFSSSSSSSTLHLHHHGSSNANFFSTFDPYSTTTSSQQVPLQVHPHHFFLPLHQQSATQKSHEAKQENNSSLLLAMNLEIETDRSIPEPIEIDPAWSNDELVALLRIRSIFDNWCPEFTWEHVSSKLEELGYRRSAEKCKQKFEEESRCFNNITLTKNNYRFSSEFEELYHGQSPQLVAQEKNKKFEKTREEEKEDKTEHNLDEDSRREKSVEDPPEDNEKLVEKSKGKKRKRQKNFDMFKGFCEDIVKKMMAQQEEMHTKLLEDMMKRDEEKLAREEAWKEQEMDRINKELEIRASEQVIAVDRQAAIIKFLNSLTSSSNSSETQCFGGRSEEGIVQVLNNLNPSTSSSLNLTQNPTPSCEVNKQSTPKMPTSVTMTLGHQVSGSCPNQSNALTPVSLAETLAPQNPSSNLPPTTPKISTSSAIDLAPSNPSSPKSQNKTLPPTFFSKQNASQNQGTANDKEDVGKRWPRDEVFALINLRCSLFNNGEDKEGAAVTTKTPLWERISQGMLELGYKRSAKRCKEKWENINKYFRKTKDSSKKRSLDSRTCPYFHHLSTLYSQGTLVSPSDGTENRPALPENHLNPPENQHGSSQRGPSTDSIAQGEKNLAQLPAAFDFEF